MCIVHQYLGTLLCVVEIIAADAMHAGRRARDDGNRGAVESEQYETLSLYTGSNTVIVSPRPWERKPLRSPREPAKAIWLAAETRPGDWEAWLQLAGLRDLRPVQVLRFDHFFVSLQAVIDGLGYGVGPLPTLGNDIQQQRLLAPFPDVAMRGSSFQALVPLDSDKPRHLRQFLEWLQTQAEQELAKGM